MPGQVLREQPMDGAKTRYLFWCPGCETHMWFELGRWGWNGDWHTPTVSPSILFNTDDLRCHLFVTGGQLVFLADCTHKLAGQTIPMEECHW